MSDEPFYRFSLSVGQVFHPVLPLLELGDVGEYLCRVGEVLVHIVEVSEQYVSPEDKVVQTLRFLVQSLVLSVKLDQQSGAVRLRTLGCPVKKVIDSQCFRCEDRHSALAGCFFPEILEEKGPGPAVRKDEADMLHISFCKVM